MNFWIVTRIAVCLCFWPVLVLAGKQSSEAIVEIKSLVPGNKIAELSRKLALGSKVPLTRTVCFFDTGSLSLFRHSPKVILRSRYDASGGSDTTVKVRDGKVQGDNAECEFDAVLGKKRTLSCSVTDKGQKKGEIKKANTGKDLKKIFSKQQEATLKSAFDKVASTQAIRTGKRHSGLERTQGAGRSLPSYCGALDTSGSRQQTGPGVC